MRLYSVWLSVGSMTFVASPRIRSVGCIYADRCVYAPDAAYTHMCLYAVRGAYTRVGAYTQAGVRIRGSVCVMHILRRVYTRLRVPTTHRSRPPNFLLSCLF